MVVCKNLKKFGKCFFYENEKKKKVEFEEVIWFFLIELSYLVEIFNYVEMFELCFYDFIKRIVEKVDVIVVSYFYVLSLSIRESLISFFGVDYFDFIVIFDEVYNFLDQVILVLSDRLSIYMINRVIKEVDEYREYEIVNFLSIFGKGFEKLYLEKLVERDVEEVFVQFELVFIYVIEILGINECWFVKMFNEMVLVGDVIREDCIEKGKFLRSYVGRVGEFFLLWFFFIGRDDYFFLMMWEKGMSFEFVVFDLLWALFFIKDVQSVIFMFGIFMLFEVFRDVMGIENVRMKKFLRMVKRENVQVLVVKDVLMRGDECFFQVYRKMVDYIVEVVKFIFKNVGVFMVFYEVFQGFFLVNFDVKFEEIGRVVFIEQQGVFLRENDFMIVQFKVYVKGNGVVLFGVMGGRNSEGQDYFGDEMNGVVFVGIFYVRLMLRVQVQIRYFEKKFFGKGCYYGYYFLVYRKFVQVVGRVYCFVEEKGSIVIFDYCVFWRSIRKDLFDWMKEIMKLVIFLMMRFYFKRFWFNGW